MYCLTEDDELSKKNNAILNKVSNSTKKLIAKKNWNESTDFHNKEMPKVNSNYICQAVMLIDFNL